MQTPFTFTDLMLVINCLIMGFIVWWLLVKGSPKNPFSPKPPSPMVQAATDAFYAVDSSGVAHKEEVPCTPWQKFKSWHRRRGVFWYALGFFLISVFGPFIFEWLVYTLTGTPPIQPWQKEPTSMQKWASNYAGNWKSLGEVSSVIFAGAGYFSFIILLCWPVLNLVFPEIGRWSKKNFTDKFRESTDYKWQIDTVVSITRSFWALFAFCLLAAALSQ